MPPSRGHKYASVVFLRLLTGPRRWCPRRQPQPRRQGRYCREEGSCSGGTPSHPVTEGRVSLGRRSDPAATRGLQRSTPAVLGGPVPWVGGACHGRGENAPHFQLWPSRARSPPRRAAQPETRPFASPLAGRTCVLSREEPINTCPTRFSELPGDGPSENTAQSRVGRPRGETRLDRLRPAGTGFADVRLREGDKPPTPGAGRCLKASRRPGRLRRGAEPERCVSTCPRVTLAVTTATRVPCLISNAALPEPVSAAAEGVGEVCIPHALSLVSPGVRREQRQEEGKGCVLET